VTAAAGATQHPRIRNFIDGVNSGSQIDGSFRKAWPITDAVNLYATALRSRKTHRYDASTNKITNDEKANSYLNRSYRKGWHIDEV
jgi:hypothetical protein